MATRAGLAGVSIDHLVYLAPDLASGVADLERSLGVRAVEGGRHPAWATRNALLGLGEGVYLEILAPDPEREPAPRPWALDPGRAAGLGSWAARTPDLDAWVHAGRERGLELGRVEEGSRRRADGVVLRWRIAVPARPALDGLMPFLLDWGDTPHPSRDAPRGCALERLSAEHPEPERVAATLAALGVALPVESGRAPALIATLRSPRGEVTLRSSWGGA
jgi:glyoxalase-like protein